MQLLFYASKDEKNEKRLKNARNAAEIYAMLMEKEKAILNWYRTESTRAAKSPARGR